MHPIFHIAYHLAVLPINRGSSLLTQTYHIISIIAQDFNNMLEQLKKCCTIDVKSNRLMNCLVFSTMVLLVLSSIVIITIISVTPIVMLAVGQLSTGQRDIIVEPRLDFLNSTKLSQLGQVNALPRLRTHMVFDSASYVVGWFMDFQKQRKHHLGTIGGDEPFNHSFIYAHQSTGLRKDQEVKFVLLNRSIFRAIKNWLSNSLAESAQKAQLIEELYTLTHGQNFLSGKFTVKEVFDTASGKFGIGNVNNFVYLDIRYALQQMLNYTYARKGNDLHTSALIKFINSQQFDLAHFSTEATVNFEDRIKIYSNPNYEQTFITLSSFCKNMMDKIGLMSVTTSMPIAGNLKNLGFIGMFIGVMFQLIICSLFLLSVLMMNNMFRMGVEKKNFDFALLKVMGANRAFIIANILAGSLKYVLLANLCAYPLAYISLKVVTSVFEDFFGYRYEITPTSDSIIGGLLIGVLVPIVSAVAPIWSVIKNDLAENLNPVRNKTEATKIETYIEGREFPTAKLIFGLIAAGFGLIIYYLLPRALINQQLGSLLVIFFIIIESLLLGLILLSFGIQYIFQRIVAYICFFWVQATDLLLTMKNLSSHRFRNRRTSLLYTLSVSFIIFVSVGLQIQLQTMYIQLLKLNGSYIVITGNIDRQFYNEELKKIDGIQDWAYVSLYLRQVLHKRSGFTDVLISDNAKMFFVDNRIYAVSPNLINTFFYEKVSVVRTEAATPYDPYSLLYSDTGLMTCTISRDTAHSFGILDSENKQFLVNIYYENGVERIPLKYTSVFEKRMGLLYSHIVLKPQIGVSFDTFRKLANIPTDEEIPIGEVKIKVKDITKVKQIADQIRSINHSIDNVWDYTELKTTLDKIDNILTKVTYILLFIVLCISFFSLMTTTYINIINQTNQIAILMILGYEKSRIVRIYIYQSFVVVLNSCLIGLGVGYLVAQMMSLQRQMFSQLPISVEIRGVPILFGMAIVSSVVCTYKPLREIFSLRVSQILNYAK